jgi:hypothetical protein
MKIIIAMFLYGSIAYGFFYLGSTAITRYGEDRYNVGYERGGDYQRQRCYEAHGKLLQELATAKDRADENWAKHIQRRKKK